MIIECMLLMACLPLIEQTIYIFNSEDGSPVQFYDCIVQNDLSYCRRPTYLINLERDQEVWDCFHNGTRHSFRVLEQHNISVSTVLREWKSSVEMAEEYAYYLRLQQEKTFVNGDEKFLCQCTHAQSFGKHCEYRLAMHTTFEETLDWQLKMRIDYSWQMQLYGDIVCYKTLNCDSGLLCLDWRDICDGVQHCMFGYDEENCDKLEFNACEGDEYRCLNAMCIPDQYFLDGNYDCMDMSDEKGKVNDENCIFREASHECDDRVCLRRYWSCGDGQCIRDWTQFKIIGSRFECASLRDQYYMRETQSGRKQWTLPNGRCFHSLLYVEDIRQNHSILEQCVYLLKCALSKGAEKNCPCESNSSCTYQLITHCNSTKIQYPIGAIFAPYASSFYNIPNDQLGQISDSVLLNGTIKCRGYMAESLALKGLDLSLNMEYRICSEGLSSSANKVGYDRSCHNGSRTFNNRSYHFIDVCHESRECISAYRINDVYPNCARGGDEERIDLAWKSCSDVEGHRLRCSNEQPLCLPVFLLGQQGPQCKNSHDEFWMGQGRPLSALACNKQSKDDCQLIRQYIERSSKMDTNLENSTKLAFVDKVPFRWFCDTFWQMNSRKDEDVGMCQEYWTCAEDQWRCDTGQCVKAEWVLDGEWDCSDASDEEAIFFSRNTFSTRNLKVRNETFLRDRFHRRYRTQPFNDICNLSTEYPCFRVDAFDALNTTHYRPCINLTQIGDGHVDCIGALDERNNRQHCNRFSMLGYYFECPGDNHCVFYDYHCARGCNDSRIQCYGYKKTPDCSDSSDFMCLNGTCARRGWCNQRADCSLGEDEYLCILLRSSLSRSDLVYYRESKRLRLEEKQTVLLLPAVFLRETQKRIVDTTRLSSHVITNYFRLENYPSSSPFWCNRGVGALLINGSIVCFCPPQYYGDKCQYHSDRLTVLVRLNLSQSTYDGSTNPKTLLKLLIILLHENKSVMIESVPIHLSTETTLIKKTIHYLLYSRSPDSLMKKRTRYFNRSMIIDHHPYSVRIEVYELQVNDEKPRLEGVWLYPIYFDFLPNFRLAKVLYLTRLSDSRDPCLSSPCTVHQECHRLLNEPSHFVCLCPPKFSGKECSIQDRLCQDNFCGSNALCKPNYRGLVRGNDRLPYCLCPLSRLGDRCQLKYDLCDRNPCLNNGICLPTSQLNSYFCLCTEEYYGNKCHLKKHSVHLRISENLDDRVALVQYFDINFVTLELILVHQHLYDSLPQSLFYLHEQTKKAPAVIVVKLYSNTKIDTYVISLQIEVEWIEGTTELSERNRCAYVDTLLPIQKEISPIQYHYLCQQNRSLLCFLDRWYLCVCTLNRSRAECFGYDHFLDQCSECLVSGRCVRGDPFKRMDFRCLCPQCYSGRRCQFSAQQLSFTLDSLIGEESRRAKSIYFTLSVLMFSVGLLTNYGSFITFRRSAPRKFGVGYYLLSLSIFNQFSLLFLLLKTMTILFDSSVSVASCKTFSFVLSFSTRYTYWLTNWITLERLSSVLFPVNNRLRNPRSAKLIMSISVIIIIAMHIHELLFFDITQETDGQVLCVAIFSSSVWSYNFGHVLVQHLVPFCIQISSITILVVLTARSRSRSTMNRTGFFLILQQQFNIQKELYITSLILICSALPQVIISSVLSCIILSSWHRHLLCTAYFFAYLPQVLGFILFVLPSTLYSNEFRLTQFGKTHLFNLRTAKKKKIITVSKNTDIKTANF